MPIDQYSDEDDDKSEKSAGPSSRFREFDCPGCNANNPCDPDFGDGDEVLCNYCGSEYRIRVTEEGRVKFKEL